MRVNPLSGEFVLSLSFLLHMSLFEDETKLLQTLTDMSVDLSNESERVFNSILLLIMEREVQNRDTVITKRELTKLEDRKRPHYQLEKLEESLLRLRNMIRASVFYKLKMDISTAHKNRSFFKKVYLKDVKQYSFNEEVLLFARWGNVKMLGIKRDQPE